VEVIPETISSVVETVVHVEAQEMIEILVNHTPEDQIMINLIIRINLINLISLKDMIPTDHHHHHHHLRKNINHFILL